MWARGGPQRWPPCSRPPSPPPSACRSSMPRSPPTRVGMARSPACGPAALSLVAFVAYLRRGGVVWLVVCGLLTGAAVLLKQSGFDGGLAAVVYLLACRRRAGVVPAAVVVGAAVVPVAVAAISAPSFS